MMDVVLGLMDFGSVSHRRTQTLLHWEQDLTVTERLLGLTLGTGFNALLVISHNPPNEPTKKGFSSPFCT